MFTTVAVLQPHALDRARVHLVNSGSGFSRSPFHLRYHFELLLSCSSWARSTLSQSSFGYFVFNHFSTWLSLNSRVGETSEVKSCTAAGLPRALLFRLGEVVKSCTFLSWCPYNICLSVVALRFFISDADARLIGRVTFGFSSLF